MANLVENKDGDDGDSGKSGGDKISEHLSSTYQMSSRYLLPFLIFKTTIIIIPTLTRFSKVEQFALCHRVQTQTQALQCPFLMLQFSKLNHLNSNCVTEP